MSTESDLEKAYSKLLGASEELNLLLDFLESTSLEVPEKLKAYLVTRALAHVGKSKQLSSEFEEFKKRFNY